MRSVLFCRFREKAFFVILQIGALTENNFFVHIYKICSKYLDKVKKVLYDLEKLNFKCIDGKSSFAFLPFREPNVC